MATKFIQVLPCNILQKNLHPTDWVGQKVRFGQPNPCIPWTMAGRQLLFLQILTVSFTGLWEDYSHPLGVWAPPVLSMVWSLAIISPPRSSSTFILGSSGSRPQPTLAQPSLGHHILWCGVPLLLTMAAPVFSTVSYSPSLPCILHKTSLGCQVSSTLPRLRENRKSLPRPVLLFYFMELCTVWM